MTVQLWADSKPLTVPVQTAYRSFKTGRIWNEWLELPFNISTLPLNSQLAITVWDVSPTGGPGAQGHAIPFGGTTISLFDKDNTLQRGKQSCRIYRHKSADGFSSSTTPAHPPPPRRRDENGVSHGHEPTPEEVELERLAKLFKKHEAGEIPQVDWLDAMVFKKVDKMRRDVETSNRILEKARRKKAAAEKKASEKELGLDPNRKTAEGEDEEDEAAQDGWGSDRYHLIIDFPRFDFPIIFTDHEYTPTPVSSFAHQTPSSNNVNLKPPPEVQLGPGIRKWHRRGG